MEAASRSRRIRLEELKKRKLSSLSNGTNGHTAVNESPATIAFTEDDDDDEEAIKTWSTAKLVRSFRVKDAKLKVDYKQLKDSIEKDVAGLQEGVIAADEVRRKEELDLTNIAPKKPNWDLKRDLNKRLLKLSRRDKESRLILIRK
jgi:coiled-coil domain-containing protein 12